MSHDEHKECIGESVDEIYRQFCIANLLIIVPEMFARIQVYVASFVKSLKQLPTRLYGTWAG